MDTIGPISRTVADAAITLRAIAGYDPKDPYSWQTPVPDYQQGLDGDIQGTRIGVLTELINDEQVEPEVREAVVNATAVLQELGARVEEVSVPLTQHANVISRCCWPQSLL
jgi:aspartyl-tRNA(Asn)/glutamyl-tRNA(Gln) amidotransferase subunit A